LTDSTEKLLALLDSQGRQLHRLLFRLTLREDVAEDLLQELFLRLRASPGFARAACPAAYARQSAIHLAFDWQRKNRRAPPVGPLPPDLAGGDDRSLADLVQREEMELIRRRLAELPEGSRDCLVLYYLEGETYEAIAQALGKTAHQVRALCAKGVGQLRHLLAEALPARKEGSRDIL
jgi:RNA polymerase sigma factor (sigma-70 family)